MKRLLFVFTGLFLISSLVSAQVLQNFNDGGNDGWVVSSGDGASTSFKNMKSPMPASEGDSSLAVSMSFPANSASTQAVFAFGSNTPDGTKEAQVLTTWIYIPSSVNMPDSMVIQTYGQDVPAYNTFTNNYFAKDIPKDKWYPLALYISQDTITQVTKPFDDSQRWVHGFQIYQTGSAANDAWSGTIYIDNVTAVGKLPSTVADFTNGFGIYYLNSHNNIDSIFTTTATDDSGITMPAMGVAVNLDTTNPGGGWFGWNNQGRSSVDSRDGSKFLYLSMWVYIPAEDTIPTGTNFQLIAQCGSQTGYSWQTLQDNVQDSIPKGRWYPVYWPLQARSIADSAGFYLNGSKNDIWNYGIQIGNWGQHTPWKGVFYVANVQLLGSNVAPPPAIWIAADFDKRHKTINGLQGFHVPSWASGTLTWYTNLSIASYTMQGTVEVSSMFAAVRDSVPMMDSTGRTATYASMRVYVPSDIPAKTLVQLFISGGANDSVSVTDTVGSTLTANTWATITIPKLDSLTTAGKFDPTKPVTVGVTVATPSGSSWTGKVEFDTLKIGGIEFSSQLPDEEVTGVETAGNNLPTSYQLYQNYPNPFNPSTVIKYDLPKSSKVVMKVYDVIGREITTLVNGQQAAGRYDVTFNAGDFASGVYIVRIVAGDYAKIQKMMLLK